MRHAGSIGCAASFCGVFSGLLDRGVSPTVVADILGNYMGFLSSSSVGCGAARCVDAGRISAPCVSCENDAGFCAACFAGRDVVLSLGSRDEESAKRVDVGESVRLGGVLGAVGSETGTVPTSGVGVASGHSGRERFSRPDVVGFGHGDKSERVGSVEGELSVSVGVASVLPGRWASSNRRKKASAKARRAAASQQKLDGRVGGCPSQPHKTGGFEASSARRGERVVGHCETVVSGTTECPSYDRALSDAEREARDTLAQRRAAENKVAKKLAEMKLASLEDEKKCQEYADLKHQRVIQWTNEATAKSQQSLDKVKSIDPSSSASQYEIRQQAKELADTKATLRTMTAILKDLSPDFEADMEACRPCGTEEFAMYAAAGGYSQYSEEIENAPVR